MVPLLINSSPLNVVFAFVSLPVKPVTVPPVGVVVTLAVHVKLVAVPPETNVTLSNVPPLQIGLGSFQTPVTAGRSVTSIFVLELLVHPVMESLVSAQYDPATVAVYVLLASLTRVADADEPSYQSITKSTPVTDAVKTNASP